MRANAAVPVAELLTDLTVLLTRIDQLQTDASALVEARARLLASSLAVLQSARGNTLGRTTVRRLNELLLRVHHTGLRLLHPDMSGRLSTALISMQRPPSSFEE